MKLRRFEEPKLFVARGDELSLSGQAVLELMRAVLTKGVPFRFRARGWSMAPFIQDGDVISVSSLSRPQPAIGEVVAFVRPEEGNLVVHRVVAHRGAAVLIRGDGIDECCDELVPPENLLGRVTRVERNGRPVWLGLGPERYLIAWFSRTGLLIPLRVRLSSWLRPYYRR